MVENLENEIWKPVKGYEDRYCVSNLGRVKSLKYGNSGKERLRVLTKDKDGYLFVPLNRDGRERRCFVHRLVYEAFHGFIPKWDATAKGDDRLEINHIDENPLNNRLENLEIVTCTQNNNYGGHGSRISSTKSKKVYQYTIGGEFVREWPSVISCRKGGFTFSKVSACCLGKVSHHKGFLWRYEPLEKGCADGG